jgi:hypothetical protein
MTDETVARSRSDRLLGRGAGRKAAAGIYGTIVTGSVIAAGGNSLRTWALAATIVVTLVVYWLAEQYAELVGEHIRDGRLPSLADAGRSLRRSFPMVTASFIPVITLLLARLAGASSASAARVALFVTAGLLVVHGLVAGWTAGLRSWRLALVAAVAGAFGLAMVALKTILSHHH